MQKMNPTKKSRKMIGITMRPDLFDKAHAAADQNDLPLTAWVRQLVEAELKRMEDQ